MDNTPLAMLVKACETLGSNPSPSNNISPTTKKSSNGTSNGKSHHHSSATKTNGHHTSNGFSDSHGKSNGSVKKESLNGNGHMRKSPKNHSNACEPSTSSPSSVLPPNAMTTMAAAAAAAQNPYMMPGGFHPNYSMGLLQRCFPPAQPPMPNGMNPFVTPPAFLSPPPPGLPMAPGAFANPQFGLMAAAAALYGPQAVNGSGVGPTPPTNVPASRPLPPSNTNGLASTTTGAQQITSAPVSTTTTTTALPASMPLTPPATSTNSASQQQLQQQQQRRASSASDTTNTTTVPDLAAMAMAVQQQQQMATAFFQAPYPAMMMGMLPNGAMPSGPMDPSAQNMNSGFSSPTSASSIQAMLMAVACGQQHRHVCSYDVKGSPCGKTFDSDSELLAHFKTHISSLVDSANGGGGKLKTGQKASPIPAASPKQQPQALPPFVGWSPNGQNASPMRFHPYMKMPQQQQQQQQQQIMAAAIQHQAQQQQQAAIMQAMQMATQYEMAAAMGGFPPGFPAGLMPPPSAMATQEKQI